MLQEELDRAWVLVGPGGVREFARHGTTMALFLSAARSGQLTQELLAGGYDEDTPCVVAYAVTWPDELVVRCRLADLEATCKEHKLWKHTLVLVGPALAGEGKRSHLYHPGLFHGPRRAERGARRVLRSASGIQGSPEIKNGTELNSAPELNGSPR